MNVVGKEKGEEMRKGRDLSPALPKWEGGWPRDGCGDFP